MGQTHTVTAHATSNNSPVVEANVQFTVTGANSASGSCGTGADGTCTFTYVGTNPGIDSIGASTIISDQIVNATPVSETWVSPNITITHATPPNVTTVFDYGPYNFKSTPAAKLNGNSLAITAIPVDPSAFSAVGGPFPTAQCFAYGGTSGKCVEFDVKCTGPNCTVPYNADFATSFDFTGSFVGKPGFLRVEKPCSPTVFSNPSTTNQITSFIVPEAGSHHPRQERRTGSCWGVVQGLDSTIYPNTDLSILKLAPPLVVKGTKLTYGMAVFNLGPNLATGVSVTDPIPLPSSMSLVSSAVCITGTSGISCTTNNSVIPPCTVAPDPNNNNAPTVTCQVGNLLPFSLKTLATAGIALTFQLNPTLASGTIINNTARVQAFNTDPRLNNNTSTAVTKVCTTIVQWEVLQ